MRRREYLGLLGGSSLTIIAGCSDRSDEVLYDEGRSHSFSGEGVNETEMFELERGLMSIEYKSDAEDVLTAELVAIDVAEDSRLIDDRLIINRMAPIEGRLMNLVSGGTYLIDVDVDGPWEIDIDQPEATYDDVDSLPVNTTSEGPNYFGPVNLTEDALIHAIHEGDGGFQVSSITTNGGWDIPINDSGRIDSTRSFRDEGIAWISVYATGSWSVELYQNRGD